MNIHNESSSTIHTELLIIYTYITYNIYIYTLLILLLYQLHETTTRHTGLTSDRGILTEGFPLPVEPTPRLLEDPTTCCSDDIQNQRNTQKKTVIACDCHE